MTFLIKKRIKNQGLRIKQEGVTLFLAILVLSSILAISFSLATILFIEVRTSSDLTKTEGALAGANGIAEQALFNIKRSACTSNCYVSGFTNHVVLANGSPQKTTIASPNLADKVLPSSKNLDNTINKYDFCSINATSTQGCGYGKVTVTYEPSGNPDTLAVYLCEFDASGNTAYTTPPCSDISDTSYMLPGSCGTPNMEESGGCTTQSWTLDGVNKQQELIMYNLNQSSTQNIYVQIQTYADIAGTIPKGLPYANKTAVSINTINGQVGRKLKVVIPNPSGSSSLSNSASFVGTDTSTQGNWKGVYGADGYNVIGATVNYPSFVSVTPNNNLFYSWADPTVDVRGLYKDAGSSTRLADTWYNSSVWTLDFNFSDSNTHRVSLYMVDWDGSDGRSQTVEVLDANTGSVLDTRNVSAFSNGQYWIWNLSGHVTFRFTQTGISNSVLSGIFFQ